MATISNSQDLATLSAFFPEGWSQQPIQQGLQKLDIAWLLATISYCLKSVGRVAESIEPREKSIEIFVRLSRWTDASTSSQNLVETLLILGNLAKSLQIARQAIEYADKGENLQFTSRDYLGSRAYLAMVLHRQGQLTEAAGIFKEIRQPLSELSTDIYPLVLHLIIEFWYCNLMLDQDITQSENEKILEQGKANLEIASKIGMLLYVSCIQLVIARSYSKLGQTQDAKNYFNESVSNIGKAERREHLPMFLVHRANFYLDQQQFAEAKRDLAEAWLIIKRSDMKLYAVDYHLAMRRAEPEKAQFHETEAKKLIAATGYHLRDKNV